MRLEKHINESDKFMRNVKKELGKMKYKLKMMKVGGDKYAVVQLLWPDTARNAYFRLKDKFQVNTMDGTTVQVREK